MHVDYELLREELPAECIADCSASGDVTAAVQYWRETLPLTVNRERAARCLRGYGAWDDLDTVSDDTLAERVLWLACGSFAEWDGLPPDESNNGSDVFTLE